MVYSRLAVAVFSKKLRADLMDLDLKWLLS